MSTEKIKFTPGTFKEDFPNIELLVNPSLSELKDVRLIYILTANDIPIVLGQGKLNRAKVIYDELGKAPTSSHFKSMFVRMYQIKHPDKKYERYLIQCEDEKQAKALEHKLHLKYGGTGKFGKKKDEESRVEEGEFLNQFTKGCSDTVKLLIKIAYYSSYSGLADLDKWDRKGLISKSDWDQIKGMLRL